MHPAAADLAELCRYAAQHPRFVQGGGGNCSVKSDGRMAVKASGYFLEDVTEQSGYVVLDESGRVCASGDNERPSLEAPLHRLLGRFVIHTHPIVAGALVCADQGREAFQSLFPGDTSLWIPYAKPGQELAAEIARALAANGGRSSEDLVLFLENHGVFVSAPGKEECVGLHEFVIQRLEEFFGRTGRSAHPPAATGRLTPDHAVYLSLPGPICSERQRQAVAETQAFAAGVHGLIAAKGWTPRYLAPQEVASVLGMSEEKYRQKLWERSR